MDLNELKKLKRVELLELLYDEVKENENLKKKLAAKEKELAQRTIDLSDAGSIAEAALKLQGVFRAADEACQSYLEQVRRQFPSMEELERRKAQTEAECRAMREEAEKLLHWSRSKGREKGALHTITPGQRRSVKKP